MRNLKEFTISFKGSKIGSGTIGQIYLTLKALDEDELKSKLAQKYDTVKNLRIISEKLV